MKKLFIILLFCSQIAKAQDGVLFLDFDGGRVFGTSWDFNQGITYSPCTFANSADSVAWVVKAVKRMTSDVWDGLVVTSDSTLFLAAPVGKRQRVILTPTYQWYGNIGGASFQNTFTNGSENPAWVFQIIVGSGVINYNLRDLAISIAHEAGHTFGLRHQSAYSNYVNGTKQDDYRGKLSQQGTGNAAFAPIMGIAVDAKLATWSKGPNTFGVTSLQDDITTLLSQNSFTLKPALEPKRWQSAKRIQSGITYNGWITPNDSDYYKIDVPDRGAVTFNVQPDALTTPDGSGKVINMLDLGVVIYNKKREYVQALAPSTEPGVNQSIILPAGVYYLTVVPDRWTSNETNDYFIGKYTLNISL